MSKEPEHFTECSRTVLSLSQQTAEQLRHRTIGLEHVLVGLVHAPGVSGDLLRGLGLSHYDVIPWFRGSYLDYLSNPTAIIELTAPVKRLLEAAVDEARRTKRIQINTGHMLLGFLRQKGEFVQQTLAYLELSEQQMRLLIADANRLNDHANDQALLSPSATKPRHVPDHETPWYIFTSQLMRLIGVQPLIVGEEPEAFTPTELINRLKPLMAQSPANSHLYAYRASLHLKSKDIAAANRDLDEAIRLNPKLWMAYFQRGMNRLNDKKYEDALSSFTAVIELRPEAQQAYINRGQAYAGLQTDDQALADYNMALKIKPGDYHALIRRGGVFLKNRAFDQALADFNAILLKQPEDRLALDNRGTVRVYIKDYEGAEADFREVLKQCPDKSRSHSNLGWLALRRGEYDKAIEYCNEAIQLDPENGPAYYSRGTARAAKGDSEGAAADYRQSLANWKNMTTKLAAPFAEEMQTYLDRMDKPTASV